MVAVSSFPAGSEVEVRSNEEGFKGSWFEATVLKPLPKYRRYLVAYASIVSDEASTKPLEDTVYCSLVRPRPPPPAKASGSGFELHQLVEAFHNDAWWKGVVSGVPRGRRKKEARYRVCFPNTREELEFKGTELREQLQWVKGNWIAVKDQKIEEENIVFRVGSRVEVSRDKENYGAAWFVGTVVKVIGKSFFLVEYENLLEDWMPLTEIVDRQFIRPSPPPALEIDEFGNVLEEVEAFYTGGWIAGVVTELHHESRCIVKLNYQQEEIELHRTALRPRFDWINQHWVRISPGNGCRAPSSKATKTCTRKRKSHDVKLSTPTFSDIGEVARRCNTENLKAKKTKEPKMHDGDELSQLSEVLKEKSLEEHLKLVDGTKSVGRRNKRRYSSLSVAALSRGNNNVEVSERSGGMNFKDKKVDVAHVKEKTNSSLAHKKSSKLKLPKEHLKLGDSTLKGCCKAPKAVEDLSPILPVLDGTPGLVIEQCQPENSTGHEQDISTVEDSGNHKANHGLTEFSVMRRTKLVVQSQHSKRKTSDNIEETRRHKRGRPPKVEQQEIRRHKRGRPPKVKNIYTSASESNLLQGGQAVVVGEDERGIVEPSYEVPTVDVSNNAPSPCHDNLMNSEDCQLTVNTVSAPISVSTSVCLYNMQADIMEDYPDTPRIESSILVAHSPGSSIHLSTMSKSFNNRVADPKIQAFPSKEDINCHDLNGLDNVVEKEGLSGDPASNGLSFVKKHDCSNYSELTTGGSLSEMAFVEIEDGLPINNSPSGSSLSRENHIPDPNGLTPRVPQSEKNISDTEKISTRSCGSSPSMEIVHVHAQVTPNDFPSERAVIEVDGRNEIYRTSSMSLSTEVALPFMKESSMWDIVNSMEIFHTRPQQPHFHPLLEYELEFREGMAIGLMVTFANVVASIPKLQITDSDSVFEEKLRTLIPLEIHGFDVQFARSRIENLLQIRNNVSQLEGRKVSLKEKMLVAEDDKRQLDAFIAAHDKIITELEEHLCSYRKRKASMVVERNRKDSEFFRSKMDLQATEEAYFTAEQVFNAAKDSSW